MKSDSIKKKEALRKTFTIEKRHQVYLVQLSVEMMKEFGRNISASEALRAIIDRDMKRRNK